MGATAWDRNTRRCRSWPDRASTQLRSRSPETQARTARCINGSMVSRRCWRPQEDDADQLADFLIELQRLCNAEGARDLRNASASIFSPAEAVAQYQQRLNRLQRSAGEHPDLREFLDSQLVPSGAAVIRRLDERYASLGWDLGAPLALAHRVLSPSDFGLHNALRGPDGQLRFVDFEYFGWDDPVKLVSDTAIHPGSDLPDLARTGSSNGFQRYSQRKTLVCGPSRRAVSCFRGNLVPDHPERLFAGKPFQARFGRAG